MAEFDRLSEGIAWIDLSFVERDRTPRWAIEVGIRCHLAGMSLREVSKHLERFGVDRVMSLFTTGFIKPIYNRSRRFLRINSRLMIR